MDPIKILEFYHHYRISHARISLDANFQQDLTNAMEIISMYFQYFTVKSYREIVFSVPSDVITKSHQNT